MKIYAYVNPRFDRSGNSAVKTVFVTDQPFAFGVYYNKKTGRIECQKYIGSFNFNNINAPNYRAACGLNQIVNSWNNWTDDEKKRVCTVISRMKTSYYKHVYYRSDLSVEDKKFILQTVEIVNDAVKNLYHGNPVNIPANCEYCFDSNLTSDNTSVKPADVSENKQWIPVNADKYEIEYLQKIIKAYHDAGAVQDKPFEFERNQYRFNSQRKMEILTYPGENAGDAVKKHENRPVRKMITLFKLKNAENFKTLFEGNFYPIIEEKGEYITIKDEDQSYKVRKNRGMKVEVFDEPETAEV